MLKQEQLTNEGIKALKKCFSNIQILEENQYEIIKSETGPDLEVIIKSPHINQRIWIALKSLGTPKEVREGVNQLQLYKSHNTDIYGLVLAPYISKRSAEICKEAGIGFLDLSGNCWISFDSIFLNRENMPNKYPIETSLSSLYSPKTERVLRVLLTYPFKAWKTTLLAEEANISQGMITHIRRRLEEEEWVEKHEIGFSLSHPDELLQNWSKHYEFKEHKQFSFYTMNSLPEIELKIRRVCNEKNIACAVTAFSAANRLAPMVRGQRSTIYISKNIEDLADEVSIKKVDTGANLILVQPYDSGVFWNAQDEQGVVVVTPIQLYLDLKQMSGRGDEAADFLYREVIEKQWRLQKSSTNNL